MEKLTYEQALEKLKQADELIQQALDIAYEVSEQAEYSTGETIELSLLYYGRDAEWIAKRLYGIG